MPIRPSKIIQFSFLGFPRFQKGQEQARENLIQSEKIDDRSDHLKKYFNNRFNTFIKTIENGLNSKLESINKNLVNLNLKINNMAEDIESIQEYILKMPRKKRRIRPLLL